MTSPLDEISFQLGQLNAGMAMLRERSEKRDVQQSAMAKQLDTVQTSIGEIKTRMKPLAEDVRQMKPHVEHYRGVRKRAAWIGALALSVGGTIGGALGNYIIKKYTT